MLATKDDQFSLVPKRLLEYFDLVPYPIQLTTKYRACQCGSPSIRCVCYHYLKGSSAVLLDRYCFFFVINQHYVVPKAWRVDTPTI